MDVEALRTFAMIHRSGGITAAADALFLSQPAVSRRIAILERELGAPLFERTPAGLVLSDAGAALLPFAEAAVALMRDAEDAVRAITEEERGPVTVALVGTLASTNLTAVLRRFARGHPGVDLKLRTATSREVSDLVRRAEAALGLRYSDETSPDLDCETLFSERMAVVVAADHAMTGRRVESLAALSGERWIAFPESPGRPEGSARYVRRALEGAGVEVDQLVLIDSLTAQKRLVEGGFGLALMPLSAVREELSAGTLAALAVQDLNVSVPVGLVTRKGGFLSAAARGLIGELRSAAASGDFA